MKSTFLVVFLMSYQVNAYSPSSETDFRGQEISADASETSQGPQLTESYRGCMNRLRTVVGRALAAHACLQSSAALQPEQPSAQEYADDLSGDETPVGF